MSFYEFIQIYSDDDTPLGNLASFVNQEANFPKDEKSYDIILKYFCECRIENCKIEYVKRALSIYLEHFNS
ncbi:YozE family protein [Staphylococcus gallinarum]|uniref:YozE family protein n=1 Tax=Staphylococcus gallinarum TaxID=1293 RepID=UPI003181D29B